MVFLCFPQYRAGLFFFCLSHFRKGPNADAEQLMANLYPRPGDCHDTARAFIQLSAVANFRMRISRLPCRCVVLCIYIYASLLVEERTSLAQGGRIDSHSTATYGAPEMS